jgi:predicted nucleic acid-binding protein
MIILDTNVLSELMRNRPSPKVTAWFHDHPLIDLYTTAITEAEIFYGIELLEPGTRKQKLLMAAESLFDIDLRDRVIGFDGDAARIFSQIAAHRHQQGKPISNPDAQIAAIVQLHGATLATRDVADFRDCGVDVVDPWGVDP